MANPQGESNPATAVAETAWFSDTIALAQPQLVQLSPNGQFVATAVQTRLVVRSTESMETVALFACGDEIDAIEWAADSVHILAASLKKGSLQAFRLQSTWSARIDDELTGISACRWAPDASAVLCTSNYSMRIIVWHIATGVAYQIKNPKSASGMSFSPNGKLFAMLQRTDCSDTLEIFSTTTWQLLQRFAIDLSDAADFVWAASSGCVFIWNSSTKFAMMCYGLEGTVMWRYNANDTALGIRSAILSSDGHVLAIGSCDDKVRLVNTLTGALIAELDHSLGSFVPTTTVVREQVGDASHSAVSSQFVSASARAAAIATSGPYKVDRNAITSLPSRPEPAASSSSTKPAQPVKNGVGWLLFDSGHNLLATKHDNYPSVIWIWSTVEAELLACVISNAPCRGAQWHPSLSQLGLVASSNKLFVWSAREEPRTVLLNDETFKVQSIAWSADGTFALLAAADRWCLSWPTSQNAATAQQRQQQQSAPTASVGPNSKFAAVSTGIPTENRAINGRTATQFAPTTRVPTGTRSSSSVASSTSGPSARTVSSSARPLSTSANPTGTRRV
ncbi:hypothetical protein CAOG_08161 [Capsaspora owczarzaki ATCC 30864]|uniref:Uncharacterized protein n=1 Tax=Capsaspora owczarzaki (strain ATCC 30864) TaxID=595528 RepID=A0A0D2UT67_CAPO3|nr:hypothetical protein CAOG_08161 [Capsaspora owczarzaki ATCC 30864]KJE98151.1 hypothetical protein CAOG_008161 [Capsaspora owczarzaki ATCC 30864]|eukprot:XP_004342762.1 hypothetical protein CAOG_08161 [Capsaspora owczarzaki ATCC 30864]